jgi:hypothetical protein
MTLDEALNLPMPDSRIEPARRHCWEVACDLLFVVQNGWTVTPAMMQSFADRLHEGVALRYSSNPTPNG